MKAYKGIFKKKDGTSRQMVFARINDLPQKFVASRILGAGKEQKNFNACLDGWLGCLMGCLACLDGNKWKISEQTKKLD